MEDQNSGNQPPPQSGPPNPKKNPKRRQLQHSADIVFSKGSSIHTVPSLNKILKGITDCVIGLQYVWEYRSPSKSVPPHYQCKLCAMASLQHDIVDHVKGWKHCYRYMKKTHPDKITHEEEDAVKDPAIRKSIKEAAAEVEKTEGRGQIKVILREPFDIPAFKGLRSAIPKAGPSPAPGMGQMGPPFGPRFSESRFPGEFHPDYPVDEFGESGFGGYSSREDFSDSGMDRGNFMDNMGRGSGGGRDSYRRSGLLDERPNKMYSDEYQGNRMGSSLMDRPMDRPGLMGAAPESSSLPHTLLTYLDTFRIENESDAQLVLKVTQKLTDVLMEYRLRSVSGGPNSLSMSSTNFSSSPPRMQSSSNRFSGGLSGPSRYNDGPPRYYK
ncbi:uncharacterized protein si:ch211-197h24.6 [Oreochromis niloticus]|uniref:Si:ch211-197h24.6 n=2 Tax=Oreochromis TaxID=8139 RepID=A0A669CC18_ORENI|nr:uncharacterized protein LOC100693004 [Oreochromis niloticus]XP_031609850.1 uncharacterized protein si:ch211-197h24.6 [Oreochromis aureus]CAI5662430.1 unnamed protein product [Mustela putorius furo]